MRIVTYDEIDRTEWGRLVRESETGTWFQSPEAFDFLSSMPELFSSFCIAVEKSELKVESGKLKELRAVCVGYVTKERSGLKQFFTRRAIVNGGVCMANNATNKEVEMLLSAIRKQSNSKTIYIETRNFNDYGKWREAFEVAGFSYSKHLNFHVDCRDKKAMWERLSDNRKRQIKKSAAISELAKSELEVREWYEILERLYRKKVKTPLWPVEFFLGAYRQGIGKFLLVKYEGKVIGGSMVVALTSEGMNELTNEGCVYEWFECGMNAEYKEQYPSVMATWAGMQFAHETGCKRYDMMGAGVPGVSYGVRDFKSEFGGTMVEHGRFVCVCKPWLYKIGQFGVKVLKRFK